MEDEVSKALAEERRRRQVVSFPVRIDQTVMNTDEPWTLMLRDQRPEQRRTVRNQRSRPLIEDLEVWLRAQRARLSAKSKTANAIDYC